MRIILPPYIEKTVAKVAKYAGPCILIGIFVFAVGKHMFTRIMLEQCVRITVATTTSASGGGYRRGNSLSYTYKVAGKQYEGGYAGGKLNHINVTKQVARAMLVRRHYVKFSCAYPSLSELLYDKEVPGSVITIPPDGWDEIPR